MDSWVQQRRSCGVSLVVTANELGVSEADDEFPFRYVGEEMIDPKLAAALVKARSEITNPDRDKAGMFANHKYAALEHFG